MTDTGSPDDRCPNCAGSVSGRFCPTCGFDLEASPDNPWAEAPEGGVFRSDDFATQEGEPRTQGRGFPVLGVVAAVAATAIVSTLAIGVLGSGVTTPGVATTTTSSEVPATDLPTSSPPSRSPSRTQGSDASAGAPDGLPAGLFCRDLKARGVSYPDAVAYWQVAGAPDRMDADSNDIPCETVYPREQVIEFWGEVGWDTAGGYLGSLPSGLYCRDLSERKLDYPQVVAYWLSQGMPDRMDDDLNGYPCETVYGEDVASTYWKS